MKIIPKLTFFARSIRAKIHPKSIPSTGVISDGFETFGYFLARLMNDLTWSLFYLYDSPERKKIANFCTKRMGRRGETNQVSVFEFTPGNGVNSDTLKNLHTNPYRQFL